MELIDTGIKDLWLIRPRVFEDERGYFFESYNQSVFRNLGLDMVFVQDNQSLSHKGVLRGLHFQAPPYAQGKLVRVIKGAVLDVVVDIRKHSPTYGRNYAVELTEENKMLLYVPEGFAHGFLTLRDHTIFSYKCTNFYNKGAEDCLLWNDPDLAIDWNADAPLLAEKDLAGKAFSGFVSPF